MRLEELLRDGLKKMLMIKEVPFRGMLRCCFWGCQFVDVLHKCLETRQDSYIYMLEIFQAPPIVFLLGNLSIFVGYHGMLELPLAAVTSGSDFYRDDIGIRSKGQVY